MTRTSCSLHAGTTGLAVSKHCREANTLSANSSPPPPVPVSRRRERKQSEVASSWKRTAAAPRPPEPWQAVRMPLTSGAKCALTKATARGPPAPATPIRTCSPHRRSKMLRAAVSNAAARASSEPGEIMALAGFGWTSSCKQKTTTSLASAPSQASMPERRASSDQVSPQPLRFQLPTQMDTSPTEERWPPCSPEPPKRSSRARRQGRSALLRCEPRRRSMLSCRCGSWKLAW
mmetsp:Transcript_44123/g.138361  ORF Transcript_44123/g.138361 Transcript_44123/m.138361 type:complete len:233 (-) Transcript_44123:968-1666(-)